MLKNKKVILIILSSILFFSCGFKPLKQQENQTIYLQEINIAGDQKISNILRNNILLISNSNSKNKYIANIKIDKQKNSKIKDKTGKVIRYTLSLNVNLSLKNIDQNSDIQKKFQRNIDYDIGFTHSETIDNENNSTKNITQQISNDIDNFITLRFSNK